uniref:Putative reverse transcriptase domain-containing protein n=1 Tax=Helianthus annuus TaxID=4232 RepID=A0A251SLN7_HELAN
MAHIKSHHLGSDERKDSLRSLRVSGQWLCGECMCPHAFSRAYHHEDKVIRFVPGERDEQGFIVGITRPGVENVDISSKELGVDIALLDRVLSLPIKSVKSIPLSCRMAFAQILTAALDKVVAMPDSVEAWVRLLILPRCTLRVFKPAGRRDKRSGNRKMGQCLSIQRSLAKWGDREGFATLVQSLFDQPARGVTDGIKKGTEIDNECGGTNVKQCLHKVADGHFTTAVKVLCSSGVAPLNKNTLDALVAKHPCMPPPSMPASLPFESPLVVVTDCVLGCIKSFPKGTSCGRDGLRAQHLLDAFCGEGSVIADSLLRATSAMVNMCLGGGARGVWRSLVISKVAMKGVGKEMAKYLGDFQFGVGIPCGAEVVLHSANRFLNEYHQDGSLAMLTIDFSNAFNLVDRTALLYEVRKRCPSISTWADFLYGQPARLYMGDEFIWSTTGVQQGDPLGPLLFALVLHPLVHRIRDRCKLLFHSWYLDDGTLIGDATQVQEGLFPRGIGRPVLGVKLLGGVVSRDAEFISSMALKRANCTVELMGCLKRLRDPQSELFLLRSCMGVAKLLFGLRTCQPSLVGGAVSVFDEGLRGALEDIVVCGGAFFGDLQWKLASLPTRFGGLGICTTEDAYSYAFVASRAQSWGLQDHILRECGGDVLDSDYRSALDLLHSSLPDLDIGGIYIKDTAPPKSQKILANALYGEIIKRFEEKFVLSPRQRVVFECLSAPHAQDFLSVAPIEGLGQHMSAVEYRAILRYRLMIPLFPVDEPCPVCHKACLDSFGEYAIHCKELPGFKLNIGMIG